MVVLVLKIWVFVVQLNIRNFTSGDVMYPFFSQVYSYPHIKGPSYHSPRSLATFSERWNETQMSPNVIKKFETI